MKKKMFLWMKNAASLKKKHPELCSKNSKDALRFEDYSSADERNCDLIVMGSHAHGVIEGALIGSTARRVVRRSKKPVLVVRLP